MLVNVNGPVHVALDPARTPRENDAWKLLLLVIAPFTCRVSLPNAVTSTVPVKVVSNRKVATVVAPVSIPI